MVPESPSDPTKKVGPASATRDCSIWIGGLAAVSDPASLIAFNTSQSGEEPIMSSQQEGMGSSQESDIANLEELQKPSASQPIESHVKVEKDGPKEAIENRRYSLPASMPALNQQRSFEVSGTEATPFSVESVIKSFSSTPGYLANRWNATNGSFSTPTSAKQANMQTPQCKSTLPARLEFQLTPKEALIQFNRHPAPINLAFRRIRPLFSSSIVYVS